MTIVDEAFLRDMFSARFLFEDKWVPAVMVALHNGPLRFSEILAKVRSYRLVDGWSDKANTLHDGVLADTLKKMTAEGLLIRSEDHGVFPPAVSYSLEPDAAKVLEASKPIVEWLRAHPHIVARAQQHRHPARIPPNSQDAHRAS